MYKYLELRDKKKPVEVVEGEDENGEVVSDIEMEAFAEQEIEKEMKRLNSGAGGITEYDDEDVSFDDSADEKENVKDGEDQLENDDLGEEGAEEEGSDSENFFSDDEELEDVKLDGEAGSDESGAEDGSEGMGGDYGAEYDDEV